MKIFRLFLLLLLTVSAYAQAPIRRQFFTTNDNPIVDVVAGSNATVQASTPAANIRRFTVNSVPGAGQTNVAVVIQGTNSVVLTNSSGGVTAYTVSSTATGSGSGQTNDTFVAALTNIVVVTNTSGGKTLYSIGGLTDTNIVTAIAQAQTNGLATTNFVWSSQVWTNDADMVWRSGYAKPVYGGTTSGPPMFFGTNGSILVGKNVQQDLSPANESGFLFAPYAISMTRSNEPSTVSAYWGAISDENYDFWSGLNFSLLGNKDTGNAQIGMVSSITNGNRSDFSVELNPANHSDLISLRTNAQTVFSVNGNGNLAIVGTYYGNGAGLTNLPSSGTGSSNITDSAYYAVARNLTVNTNADINNLTVTNLTVDSGSGIGYLSLENSGTNIITLNGTNGTITSVTNIAQQFVGDGTGLSNVPFAIFTNYAVSADYTNVGALAFGTNLYGMTSFWTYASVPIVGVVPIFNFGIDTNTVITTNGGAFSGRILQNNASAIAAPLTNELVTAAWTRNLFTAANIPYYTSTNVDITATNVGTSQLVYQYLGSIPISFARSYATAFLTNGGYLGATITTNTFQELGGGVLVAPVVGWAGGSGTRSLSYKSELYISTDKTNWYGDWSSGIITLSADTTNYTPVLVDVPRTVATNAGGFYLQRRLKITSVTYSGSPTVWFLGGTNALTGTADASHISLPSPTSTAGNAYLAANQTFTGSNVFSTWLAGNGGGLTNLQGSNIVGSINAILVGTITNEINSAGNIAASGTFTGNGGGLTNLSASITSPNAGLSQYVSVFGVSNAWTSSDVFFVNETFKGSAIHPWLSANTALGGGSGITAAPSPAGSGWYNIAAYSTNTGSYAALRTAPNTISISNRFWFESALYLDELNKLEVRVGAQNSYSAAPASLTDIVGWLADTNQNANWIAICMNNSSATMWTSALPITVNSKISLGVKMDWNGGSPSAVFYTNRVSAWTNSVNLPWINRACFPCMRLMSTASDGTSTLRHVYIDWFSVLLD